MPRKIRCIIPKIPHHVVQRGNNHQEIFFDKKDREYFCENLKKYSNTQKVYIGAYCLMTNHLHLLLYPDREEGLINFMKFISQIYSQYINRKYKRSGKFWENRYKLHLVDPAYEWVVARYIELNPVRASIVRHPAGYQYSSARKNLKKIGDGIVSIDIIKGKQNDYQEFIGEKIEAEETKQIQEALQQNKAVGGKKFIERVEERFSRVFKIRKRGRPTRELKEK